MEACSSGARAGRRLPIVLSIHIARAAYAAVCSDVIEDTNAL